MKNLNNKIESKLIESGHLKKEDEIITRPKTQEDLTIERYLEKYSELLLEKVEEKLKNK
jgi:hypothetical protein